MTNFLNFIPGNWDREDIEGFFTSASGVPASLTINTTDAIDGLLQATSIEPFIVSRDDILDTLPDIEFSNLTLQEFGIPEIGFNTTDLNLSSAIYDVLSTIDVEEIFSLTLDTANLTVNVSDLIYDQLPQDIINNTNLTLVTEDFNIDLAQVLADYVTDLDEGNISLSGS